MVADRRLSEDPAGREVTGTDGVAASELTEDRQAGRICGSLVVERLSAARFRTVDADVFRLATDTKHDRFEVGITPCRLTVDGL